MKSNVFITAWERGKRIYSWEGHNTWTIHGREYLAEMLTLNSYGPDVPAIATSRLKHMQFGVGGNLQGTIPVDVDTAYPAGFDPNTTTGNEYDHRYSIEPPISTLERPVRISGTDNPYPSADPGDVWLTDPTPPKFIVTFPTTFSVSLRYFISGADGDIVYAPFTSVPITEAGLVLSGDADINEAYNPVVTYVNFTPITLTADILAEIVWIVGF